LYTGDATKTVGYVSYQEIVSDTEGDFHKTGSWEVKS
jgi:hypothetical protein